VKLDATAHPWVAGDLRIARAALEAVAEEALAAHRRDEEACGYLVGPASDALLCDEAVRMDNLANKLHAIDPETYFRTGRSFFAFNEKKFDDAVRRGAEGARPVKVLFHSHLDVGAYFSPTDRAVMSMGEPPATEGGAVVLGPGPNWPLAFLVTSVRDGRLDDHALFIWDGADFVPGAFTVVT
jgi:[CysO sulfur-carrier protein]-S-L-cysteine hydrolase